MNVVCHQNEWPELVVSQSFTAKQRIDYNHRDSLQLEERRAHAGGIQIPVNRCKRFAIGYLARWRDVRCRQRAVQEPGEEESTAFGVDVREAAPGDHAKDSSRDARNFSPSHECERDTYECVRHEHNPSMRHHRGARR